MCRRKEESLHLKSVRDIMITTPIHQRHLLFIFMSLLAFHQSVILSNTSPKARSYDSEMMPWIWDRALGAVMVILIIDRVTSLLSV